MKEKLWELINSKVGLTVIGFVFTTILAGWINTQYQQLAWLNKKQFEMLHRALTQQETFTNDLAALMDDRFFWVQKVFWSLEAGDEPDFTKSLWVDKYYPTVVNWNRNLSSNISHIKRLTRLAPNDISEKFYTDEDDISYQEPDTVHGHFKSAHYAVRTLACCNGVPNFCSQNMDKQRCVTHADEILKEARLKIQQLAKSNTKFLDTLQNAFDLNNEGFHHSESLLPHFYAD